jgi:hypothetical protein
MVLHQRIRHSEELLHTALYRVLFSSVALNLLFVAILVICILLFSRAAW